jgi:uncharacterized membrane protein
MGGVFLASSVVHLVHPSFFESIVPRWLPSPRAIVYASGVVEAVCGWGLLTRRAWAGPASVVVLIAIFPANLQMALDAGSGRHEGLLDSAAVAWGRLPLQLPMIWAAWQGRLAS